MIHIKYLIFFSLLVLSVPLLAQKKNGFAPVFRISQNSMISSGNDLPFWMVSNQNGIISLHNSTYLQFIAGFSRELKQDTHKNWGYTYGANMVYSIAGTTEYHPNEYWLGLRFKNLIIKAGAQSDPILYKGLSSTNGNMYRSGNARPVPGLSLSTNGYIPFVFAKKWFSFRFQYEEGILKDKQYVSDTHLHHKNFHFRALLSPTFSLSIGLEHYVFWGGYSPKDGDLPEWNQYFRYVFGLAGGVGASLNDQDYKAGNQLGSYNLELKKEWNSSNATFYWNHPFEDRSGVELDNIRDGLWGIHWGTEKESAVVTDIVYEYMCSLNQSGPIEPHLAPTPGNPTRMTGRGQDNYFNHPTYPSGYTHFQRMMGTPLFVPEIGSDGISTGFENTRMWMHHLGIGGMLGKGLFWKSLMSWSRSFGSYKNVYPLPRDEFSFLAECNYKMAKLPFDIKVGLAGDYGTRFEQRIGGYLGIGISF